MGGGRTVVSGQGWRRWGAVAGVVLVLAAIPVVVNVWPARAADVAPGLLRQRISDSGRRAYFGYAQSAGLLGLPELPNLGQVTKLASSTTEMRTWFASPERWRVDVLGEGTEQDLYQTPDAQYSWDFGDNQLIRIEGAQPVRLPRAADLTPPALVKRLLDLAGGDTLTAVATKRVAGIAAAGLRITPAGPDTTVDHVDVWADPGTGLPLQAEITAKGGVRPVFVTRFLELHYGTPDSATLTPPAPRDGIGFGVTQAPDILSAINRRRPVRLPATLAGEKRRQVGDVSAAAAYGTGLSAFVVAGLPGRFGGQAYRQVSAYGLKISDEASIITTGLLNVAAINSQDRVYLVAGLVGPDRLKAIAEDLA
jgi:hypothetical protein